MYPFCEVDHTATGGLQQHRTSERGSVESQLSEGRVKLHLSLGDGLNLLTESFEGSFQFLSQFSFSLFITYKSVTRPIKNSLKKAIIYNSILVVTIFD